MLVYAGIDEAGYGPLLGPLCIGASVFVLDDADPEAGAPNLWRTLSTAVCRSRRDKRKRLAIDDSKKLKGARSAKAHPLLHLERGVLTMIARASRAPTDPSRNNDSVHLWPGDDAELFARLGVTVPDRPWYGSETTLPLGNDPARLAIDAGRLRRALDKHGVTIASIGCEAIDAGTFNADLERMGRKSTINLGAITRKIDAIWRTFGHAHPRIIVDRQGGRTHYRQELQLAFPEASIQIIAEETSVSRYVLTRGEDRITLTFAQEAEDRHLPVALASMVAKLVRELMMLRLNRFFTAEIDNLRPTAGYVTDGRRYVAEIEPVIKSHGLERTALIRQA